MPRSPKNTHCGLRLLNCLAMLLLISGTTVSAREYAYEPDADPAVTYQHALEQARQQKKSVLLVFGSEWCPDCRSLNKKMGQAPLRDTIEKHFIVSHVDIGNWDRNMAFIEQFGSPVAKGIPSIAIVGSDKTLLYVSEAGEFASARSMGLASLDAWFRDRLALIEQQ